MNAHLPAHLDSMKALPRDAVHAALRASQDGKALTAESEWRRFLGELTSLKGCRQEPPVEAWATCETPTAKRMTWTDFRNHVVAQFLDADDQSERPHAVGESELPPSMQALSLVDDAPLKRCRELLERCRRRRGPGSGEALVGPRSGKRHELKRGGQRP